MTLSGLGDDDDDEAALRVTGEACYAPPMSNTFTYHGVEIPLFSHMYNSTWMNERGAELAAYEDWHSRAMDARDWVLQDTVGNVLEVGNVLNHYPALAFPHTVVDRYETDGSFDGGVGVHNMDVFDVRGQYELIVAISTLEHVRWDEPGVERDGQGAIDALIHLHGLLAPKGRMLVTVPGGHHPVLDEFLAAISEPSSIDPPTPERSCTMVRDMDSWRQTDTLEFRPYGLTQPWAESVWIGEFRKP